MSEEHAAEPAAEAQEAPRPPDPPQAAADQTGAPASAPAAEVPHPHLALIDQWFRESFIGSPITQIPMHFGIVHAAVEDLKRRITSAKGV